MNKINAFIRLSRQLASLLCFLPCHEKSVVCLRNNAGRAIGSEAALQKVTRKTMLKHRASHREKTGKLKKKKKKAARVRSS